MARDISTHPSDGEMHDCIPGPVFPRHLLHLHASVLEPDFNLAVSEVDAAADLEAALSSQIHVEEKLFLQLECLVFGVRTALLPTRLS